MKKIGKDSEQRSIKQQKFLMRFLPARVNYEFSVGQSPINLFKTIDQDLVAN